MRKQQIAKEVRQSWETIQVVVVVRRQEGCERRWHEERDRMSSLVTEQKFCSLSGNSIRRK